MQNIIQEEKNGYHAVGSTLWAVYWTHFHSATSPSVKML